MTDIPIHPERLCRPRHPLRPRICRSRRVGMVLLLLFLWTLISGYFFITNQNRVRSIAANYLGTLAGGEVRIGGADLSLFEGLRLQNVQLIVPDGRGPQSTLLDAGTVTINCNLRDLLSGKLAATQIIVVEPHVHLAQDSSTGMWNYQLLGQSTWPTAPSSGGGFSPMPEVLLRDAQVDYLEVRDTRARQVGWMAVDGRFGPLDPQSDRPRKYEFSFQSRGRQGLGPTVTGWADLGSGRVSAALGNVVFGPDTQAMLPIPVSRWCRDHNLAGSMEVQLDYVAGGFRVKADLDGVELSVAPRPQAPPLKFSNVYGMLTFTNDGITAGGLTLEMENNTLSLEGSFGGYSPDASMDLTLRSLGELNLARNLPSIALLPQVGQDLYHHFHPWGRATAVINLKRAVAAGPVKCTAEINVIDGAFTFANIPYPVAHVTGKVVVGHDDQLGFDDVRLIDLKGRGADGSANENAKLSVSGWIGPFDHTAGGVIDVTGSDISDEPALRAALPPPARRAIESVDARHEGFGPSPRVSFTSEAIRKEAGNAPNLPWITQTDVNIANAQATYAGFPYRLDKINGTVQVRDGYVNLVGIQGRHGAAAVLVGGRIDVDHSGKNISPDLRVAADDVPIDGDLLAALPAEPRRRLQSLGISGTLDAIGAITAPMPGYNLDLTLHDVSVSPHGVLAAEGLNGDIEVSPGHLETHAISGHRGNAVVEGAGWLDWTGPHPVASLLGHARNLLLEEKIRDLLPEQSRGVWNQLEPSGTVNVDLSYDSRDPNGPIQLAIRPLQLSVSPQLSPEAQRLKLDDVGGVLNIAPGRLASWDVTAIDHQSAANEQPGKIAMSGSWKLDDPSAPWEVRLSATNLAADAALIKSLPSGLVQVLEALQLRGGVGFEFTRLSYRAGAPAVRPGAPAAGPDVDFAVDVQCDDGAMVVGVPMDKIQGAASLSGSIRNGSLHELSGDFTADSLRIAGRWASDVSAHLSKPADEPTVHVASLRAVVAGGNLAGDLAVGLASDPANPSAPGVDRYALRLLLDGADVQELAGDSVVLGNKPNEKLIGHMSASLELSGSVNDPAARRGRGDVRVVGEDMYRLPLVLGLFQITNLALPISSPFERATARYSVQGERVTLEQIQIGGKNMAIQGSGHLDFATKQVDLIFTTDDPGWLNVPIVGPMWTRAQNELLRIHVKGSISAPKVSASSLDTFTTTIDQVFRGEQGK